MPVSTPPVVVPSPPKIEAKPEIGDFCFNNKKTDLVSDFDVKIAIYDKGSERPLKTINVTSGQTSCVYELVKGIYRIELSWLNHIREIKKETKEIRVVAGKSDTMELVFNR